MDIKTAQNDLSQSYLGGGIGAIVSGCIWAAAGAATLLHGSMIGFAVLFFGGMLIFPISASLVRAVFKCPPPHPDNPHARIVIETVPPMIAFLIAAWLIFPAHPEWTFPLAAIAVGTHYFAFRSAYGLAIYWVLAAALTGLGCVAIWAVNIPDPALIFTVSVTEIIFGIIITRSYKRTAMA